MNPHPTMAHTQRAPSLLDLNDDCIKEICDAVAMLSDPASRYLESPSYTTLHAVSMTCRRVRYLAAPRIFRGIKIGPHGWNLERASAALDSLENCVHIRAYTRNFRLELFPERGSVKEESGLPSRVATVIANLKKLERMVFNVPESQHTSSRFKRIFKAMDLQLLTVWSLYLPVGSHWLIDCCPNVKAIRIGLTGEALLPNIIGDSSPVLAQLHHFEMPAHWDTDILNSVLRAMPNLTTLSMTRGALYYREGIETMVTTIARFPKLRLLVLASVTNLKVGFGIPYCGGSYNGNVFIGPLGVESIPQERNKALHFVGDLVFAGCPDLQTLWIGDDHKAVRTRKREGAAATINISKERRTWPPAK